MTKTKIVNEDNMKGQIIKIVSNDYFVSYQNKEYICKARGKLRNKNLTLKVGDYCIFNEKKTSDRRNLQKKKLTRKTKCK